jgi:hypothetical protein
LNTDAEHHPDLRTGFPPKYRMRNWINLVEGLGSEKGLAKTPQVLEAIFAHIQQQVDPDISREEFDKAYGEFEQRLKFPMRVYRALSFEDAGSFFNAHTDDLTNVSDDEQTRLHAAIETIDFSRIGICWTDNRAVALAGGALGGGAGNHDGAHIILEATINPDQCDLLTTMFHNLTVYQEEHEITLYANTPVTITGVTPHYGMSLPIKANTGPDRYDHRASVVDALRDAMRAIRG